MLEYLEELCLLPGVSSFEGPVREFIKSTALEDCGVSEEDMRTDVMGTLYIVKKASPKAVKAAKKAGRLAEGSIPKLMIAAHMDEIGFIVTHIEDNGYLRFACMGGIDKRVVLGRKVYVGQAMVPGVIGLKAIHLTTKEDREVAPDFKEMYIDIGASSREEAMENVALGDEVVFHSDFVEFGEGRVKAKAIDDRFGCAMMLKLMKEELPMDVTYAFTVQEELGTRGAYGAAYSVAPDIAIVFEGASCSDLPTVSADNKITVVGAGPVIGLVDGGAIYDRGLFELLTGLADEAGLPWQVKQKIAGGTDASTIQRSLEGIRVANISVAVRNIHSASTIASEEDMDNAYRLAKLFVEALAEGKAN
jgi:endoglucanase